VAKVDDYVRPFNPLVATILRSRFHMLLSGALCVVSWSGRQSGKRFSIPTGYQREGDEVIVMLTKPFEKSWWKNFRSPWPADLLLAGEERTAMGELVPAGSDAFLALVGKTVRATPWMAKQFGLEGFDPAVGWTPALKQQAAIGAAAVRFELTD
jgi:hypothetical protein